LKKIKRIMFASDFSEASREAKDVAVSFSDQMRAELHVVHVFDLTSLQMPSPYYFLPGVDTWMDDQIDVVRKNGQEMLNGLVEELGKEVKFHFVEGKPGREIVRVASENEIDLVVLGTHGYTGLNRLIMGSVAEYVVRSAGCPVLIVKHKGQEEE